MQGKYLTFKFNDRSRIAQLSKARPIIRIVDDETAMVTLKETTIKPAKLLALVKSSCSPELIFLLSGYLRVVGLRLLSLSLFNNLTTKMKMHRISKSLGYRIFISFLWCTVLCCCNVDICFDLCSWANQKHHSRTLFR